MKAVETVKAYLQAYPHIGETGFLFRRHLPAKKAVSKLQDGRSWIAFWRENRNLPDGTVASASRKSLGMTGERNERAET